MSPNGLVRPHPGEQAGWTDGLEVGLWRAPQSGFSPIQGEVDTLFTAGNRVPSPLAILFYLFFFFFGPHKCWRKGREGRFVSNWFQEAGARPLFFQSKAETVHIRTRSMKSILRGSVCVCRMGWGLVLTTIISRLSPLPGPEAGSHTPPSSPCPKAAAEEPSTNHRGPCPQSHSA